jgi:hypothetical protein
MTRIITTYLVVLVLVSLGFFGVGAIASAAELQDSMQPANRVAGPRPDGTDMFESVKCLTARA